MNATVQPTLGNPTMLNNGDLAEYRLDLSIRTDSAAQVASWLAEHAARLVDPIVSVEVNSDPSGFGYQAILLTGRVVDELAAEGKALWDRQQGGRRKKPNRSVPHT